MTREEHLLMIVVMTKQAQFVKFFGELFIVLSSHRFCGSWAPGVSRSHLDSAVELGCSDRNSLCHCLHRFLTIAQ
jgi:hypothetical protein